MIAHYRQMLGFSEKGRLMVTGRRCGCFGMVFQLNIPTLNHSRIKQVYFLTFKNHYKKYNWRMIFFLTFFQICTFIRTKWIKVDVKGVLCFEEALFIRSIPKAVSSFLAITKRKGMRWDITLTSSIRTITAKPGVWAESQTTESTNARSSSEQMDLSCSTCAGHATTKRPHAQSPRAETVV